MFHAHGVASLAALVFAMPVCLGAQTTTIAQADMGLYFNSTLGGYALDGSVSYANSGALDFGTTSSGDILAIGYFTTDNFLTISSGTVKDYTGYIGSETDSSGTVTVTGESSSWTNSNNLYVGRYGTGTLTIEKGGVTVSNYDCLIGAMADSTGTVTVTGAGSALTNYDELYVGLYGTGTLKIENGGTVTNSSCFIGALADSTGTVTVTGAGSTCTNISGDLTVGRFGTGTLTIENGGTVSNSHGIIGSEAHSTGTVTVTGAGSTWTNTNAILYVGYSGTGTLKVEKGGKVSNAICFIGDQAGGTGTVTVTGAGSALTNSSYLTVGLYGTGKLYITDGALVTATTVNVGNGSAIYLGGGYLVLAGSGTDDLNTLNALLNGGTKIYAWNGTTYELITSSSSPLISCGYYPNIETYDALDGYNLTGYYTVLTSLYSVPEPATYALFGGLGALGLALLRRRKSK